MTALLLLLLVETREPVHRKVLPRFYIVPDTCNNRKTGVNCCGTSNCATILRKTFPREQKYKDTPVSLFVPTTYYYFYYYHVSRSILCVNEYALMKNINIITVCALEKSRVNVLPGFTERRAHYLLALSVIDNYTALYVCACACVWESGVMHRVSNYPL